MRVYQPRAQLININMSNIKVRNLLKDHLHQQCGIKREETVDFIWNQLAAQNVQLNIDNKENVLQKGKLLCDELLKDW